MSYFRTCNKISFNDLINGQSLTGIEQVDDLEF